MFLNLFFKTCTCTFLSPKFIMDVTILGNTDKIKVEIRNWGWMYTEQQHPPLLFGGVEVVGNSGMLL